jgi:hypothetical protein
MFTLVLVPSLFTLTMDAKTALMVWLGRWPAEIGAGRKEVKDRAAEPEPAYASVS